MGDELARALPTLLGLAGALLVAVAPLLLVAWCEWLDYLRDRDAADDDR